MRIERKDAIVKITHDGGGFRETASIEANLLFEILEKLEEIRCGLIDLEEKEEDLGDFIESLKPDKGDILFTDNS